MKKTSARISSIITGLIITIVSVLSAMSMSGITAEAAGSAFPSGTVTCYSVVDYNFNVSSPSGTIYGSSDQCQILSFNESNGTVRVKFPIKNGYKTSTASIGYFIYNKNYNKYYVNTKSNAPVYTKPDMKKKIGTVYSSDRTLVVSEKGSSVQIIYPTSGNNYKMGWMSSSYLPTGGGSGKIYSYAQYDSRWGNHYYGYSNAACTKRATISSGGCGILSLTNAAANLTGNFIDPTIIADYAVKYGYRVNGVGTAYGLYKSFCNNRGSQYGIKYVGYTSSWSSLRSYISSGNAAIVHVPGHIMTVVKYDSSTGKYLLIDSYPSSNRGTSSGYAWKTQSQLSSMGVSADFYVIGKR